jgi:FkbM family methyltransferase
MDAIVNGIAMDLDPLEAIQRQMIAGCYELEQTKWVRSILGPGSVFVDVGASFGWYTTLALSLVGKGGRVFAFEPSPLAYATLKRAVDGSSYHNATLVNAAVGQRDGEITIYIPQSGPVHSPSAFGPPGEWSPLLVPVVALDTFKQIVNIPHIDLIKMDVEGSEPDVLEGMVGLLKSGRVQRVLCEFNSSWLNANRMTVDRLAARFADLGFQIERATEWSRNIGGNGSTYDLRDVLYRLTLPQ